MIIIIMAGGLGKRMESEIPKVLHKVINPYNINEEFPMLIHVINTSIKINPNKIFIIVGKYKNIIQEAINEYINSKYLELIEYVIQEPALGTGHAINCTIPQISNYFNERAIILSGDVPLISVNILEKLIGDTNKLLITELENPYGCGRILFKNNDKNNIIGIREEKDCNDNEKKINFVNCGIYQILVKDLINLIPFIKNENKSNEYYLTDIIYLMIKNSIIINGLILEKKLQYQTKNINTKNDLELLNNYIKSIKFKL